MTFKKGKSGNPSGRPKGKRDKFTDLKTSFLNVYQRMGGDDELLKWAKKSDQNKGIFFKMVHTMLPKDVQTTVQQSVRISWGRDGDAELIPDAHVIAPQLTEGDEE